MNDNISLSLCKAADGDFPRIRAFYDAVIDGTNGMEQHARRKKGSHPFDDVIKAFISGGDMYMCMYGDRIAGVMAVPFRQDEEYHRIEWGAEVKDDEIATLHIFAIAPEYQGKGFGKKAVSLATDMARENGMKAFRLDALECNTPAHRLYEALGFKLRGKQHLYTDNAGWIDFFYYEKLLTEDIG